MTGANLHDVLTGPAAVVVSCRITPCDSPGLNRRVPRAERRSVHVAHFVYSAGPIGALRHDPDVLTLRLWELVHLAAPMLVLLVLQVALVWVMCVVLSFRVMGRDYESAVMSGGFWGFMLGTTANAMACMDVLVRKFGPAPKAFVVVPIVGAFLIDFTNALVITAMVNLLR